MPEPRGVLSSAVLEAEEAAQRERNREGRHGRDKACMVRRAPGSGASAPGVVPIWLYTFVSCQCFQFFREDHMLYLDNRILST